jgi:hypothetical protein
VAQPTLNTRIQISVCYARALGFGQLRARCGKPNANTLPRDSAVARGGQKKRAPADRATGAKCLHEGPTCVTTVTCTRRILTGSFQSMYSLECGEFLWLAEQNPAYQGTGTQGSVGTAVEDRSDCARK